MILSVEERDAWAKMLAEAWSRSTSVAFVAADLRHMLDDAEQAHVEWAKVILDEALSTGLQAIAKKYHRQQVKTAKGPISTTIGVLGSSGKYEQTSILDVSTSQLRRKLQERESRLRAESRNAAVIRRVLAICDRHPNCQTVRAALRAEGLTLADVLDGAA